MKKNFFAKLGHFFLVSAVLFNGFGVAFVKADVVEVLGMSPNTATLSEGDINPISLVTISNSSTSTINLTFTMSGEAVRSIDGSGDYELFVGEGSPFVVVDTNLISVPANDSVIFPINIINDTVSENAESFGLTFETASYDDENRTPVEGFSSRGAINFTINDNDITPPTFDTIVPSPFSRNESDNFGGIATFINNASTTLDFHFEISGTASTSDYIIETTSRSINENGDVMAVPNSVDLENGIISGVTGNEKRRFNFKPVEDTEVEIDETVIITLKYATDIEQRVYDFADISYTTIIKDNDTASTTTTANVTFSFSTSTINENSGNVNVANVINNENQDVSVKFTFSGTAVYGTDYTLRSGTGTSIFGNGTEAVLLIGINSSSSFPLTLNTVDSDKTVEITLTQVNFADNSTTTSFTAGNVTTHTLTIKNVPTSGENNIPTIKTPIATQYIDLYVTSTLTINNEILKNLFFDLDTNDRVGISLTNNTDATVVTTTSDIEFSSLVLTGLKVGTSTIELTGDDHRGGIVTSTFDVIVTDSTPVEGNNAPTSTVIDDKTLEVGQTFDIIPSVIFEDVEDSDDKLTYGVEISAGSVVSVTTTNFTNSWAYTFTAESVGTSTITLSATDLGGLSTSTSFKVTVTEDVTPILIKEIVNQTLKVGESVVLNLNDYFSDPNEDVLSFLTSINVPNLITTTLNTETNKLTITGVAIGTTLMSVTASDSQHSVYDIFNVTVKENNEGNTDNNTGSSNGGGSLLPNTAPQASMVVGQEVTIEVNKEITFDASSSVDKEGNIRFYFWNFGDGSDEVYYTVPTVKYTYTKIGNYTLNIKVKDAYGAESSAQVKVKVVAGKASTNTGTPNTNTESGTKTETETTTSTSTTDTPTPVEETGSTGSTNNNTNNNTSANNTEEEAITTEEENTSIEEETTSENTEEEITEEVPAETTEELPTWIKIIFGSGALAAIAGAGLAINRVRKNV
ncbi:MAG: PKD domain-containing protein [Candidatus Magasanikbacteria bacterium]